MNGIRRFVKTDANYNKVVLIVWFLLIEQFL